MRTVMDIKKIHFYLLKHFLRNILLRYLLLVVCLFLVTKGVVSYSSKEVIRNFLIVSLILLVLSTLCYKLVKRKVTTMYHLTGDVTVKDVDSLSDIIDLYYLFLESALLLHIVACYLPMLFTAIIILFLLLCVFVAFGYAISLQFIPFLGLAVCGIFSATGIIKELTNDDSDVRSTLTENSTSTQNNLNADSNLAQVSSTDAEASYNAVSYVNIQLLLDKIERNIQKGYKFRNIDIARYRNIYFKEIVNNCKTDNLPKTTIDGYAKVLNSLLDDMYDAELESNILESNAALATLQSLTQIDGIQKDSIQDFCVNRSQEAVESINDSESTDDSEFTNDSASDN